MMDIDGTIKDLKGQLEVAKQNFWQVNGALIAVRQLKEQADAESHQDGASETTEGIGVPDESPEDSPG